MVRGISAGARRETKRMSGGADEGNRVGSVVGPWRKEQDRKSHIGRNRVRVSNSVYIQLRYGCVCACVFCS